MSSGGYFDYKEYYIRYIMDELRDYMEGHEIDDEDSDYRYGYYDDMDYVREHMHTKPNRYGFSEETLSVMRECLDKLKEAYVYVKNVDELLSSDTAECNLKKYLAKDLEDMKNNKMI